MRVTASALNRLRPTFGATMRRLASVTAVTIVATAAVALPAHAADGVDDFDQLQAAALDCPDDHIAVLTTDINEPDEVLQIGCDLTIDMANFDLQVLRITILDGNHLTLTGGDDSSVVSTGAEPTHAAIETTNAALTLNGDLFVLAVAGSNGAGIGGSIFGNGGTVTIEGNAEVFTTGWNGGAGIGGGTLGDGGSITISGAAKVTATGTNAAGIGGGYQGNSGTIDIGDEAQVVANGGSGGAGIGGGRFRNAEAITIGDNAIVTATGGDNAAGIGGGYSGNAATVTITDSARVTATAGSASAGIGGGDEGNGGVITIAPGAVVTAMGGHTAVGAGFNASAFGSLSVAGTLHIPTGVMELVDADADFVVTPTGRLLGAVGNETTGAQITGHVASSIINRGVISLDAALIGVAVAENNFWVQFDTQGGTDPDSVRVFGPMFDGSFRTLPAAPPNTDWNSAADGTGEWFTATTLIDSDRTLYAAETSSPTIASDVTATATVGVPFTLTPTVAGSPTPTVTTSSTLPLGLTLDPSTGVISGNPVDAVGDYPVTLTASNALGTDDHEVTIELEAGVVSVLNLTASADAVRQGDTIEITASGADEADNPLGDVTDDITLSSDVDTDIIAGNTVTFVDASPHTITAVHTPTGAIATIVIDVTPSAGMSGLADTGSLVTPALMLVAMSLIGAGAVAVTRLRRSAHTMLES